MAKSNEVEEVELISCLRNEKVVVKFAPRPNKNVTDPKHEVYGGMANGAVRIFTVQMQRNFQLTNPLTDSEKAFLEEYMGMEKNALSIYKKENNFWRNQKVILSKSNTHLDLSIPEDYIKYKILLTNKDLICPSLKEFTSARKETYQFYIVNEDEEMRQNNTSMTSKMEAMLELGKILENKQMLKFVVEAITGRGLSKASKLDMIQSEAFKIVDSNPKSFLDAVKDPNLKTKLLMSQCVEAGVVMIRSGLYYTADGQPICENGEDSNLSFAVKYLNSPKRQEVRMTLEAKLKAKKE